MLLVAACGLLGCSTQKGVLAPGDRAVTGTPRAGVADPDYKLAAGDLLEVRRSKGRPAKAAIGNDGSVRIAGGDAVRVDNLTAKEAASELAERLGHDFADCTVTVAKYNSQFVYVVGDPRHEGPRAVPYQGKEELPELLARVGCQHCTRGFRARIVRAGPTMGMAPEVVAVRLDPELNQRSAGAPTTVRPNDYVYLERDTPKNNEASKHAGFWSWPKRLVRARSE